MARWLVVLAALLGASGVGIGAAGAHAIPGRLEKQGLAAEAIEREIERVETGVRYQLLHAAAILSLGIFGLQHPRTWFTAAGLGMVVGTLLFSGFLFLHAFFLDAWLLKIVPYGGTLLILSWLVLGVGAIRFRSPPG